MKKSMDEMCWREQKRPQRRALSFRAMEKEQEEMEEKNLACFFSPTQHHSSSSKHTSSTSLNTNRASLEETTTTLVVVGECRESILVGESREEISIVFGEGNIIGLDGEADRKGLLFQREADAFCNEEEAVGEESKRRVMKDKTESKKRRNTQLCFECLRGSSHALEREECAANTRRCENEERVVLCAENTLPTNNNKKCESITTRRKERGEFEGVVLTRGNE